MKILICSLSAILFFISGIAQKKFTPGYITKNNQDTIRGYLQEEVKKDLVEQVAFKNDQSSSTVNHFRSGEISGFGYDNGNVYKSISFKKTNGDSSILKTCFAKQLIKGYYDLYVYLEGEESFYVILRHDSSQFLFNTIYTANGEIKQQGNYLEKMRLLSASCPELYNSSNSLIYAEKEMGKFMTDVDHCVSPGSSVTSYYHKTKFKTDLFVYAGGMPLGKQSQITGDISLRFSSPQINKNAYLNIGVHYSNTLSVRSELGPTNHPYDISTRHLVYSIPFTFQYNFTSGIIQPYLYFGFGYAFLDEIEYPTIWTTDETETKSSGISLIAGVGVEAHITPKFFVNAEWRYELLLQFPSIGFAYKF